MWGRAAEVKIDTFEHLVAFSRGLIGCKFCRSQMLIPSKESENLTEIGKKISGKLRSKPIMRRHFLAFSGKFDIRHGADTAMFQLMGSKGGLLIASTRLNLHKFRET